MKISKFLLGCLLILPVLTLGGCPRSGSLTGPAKFVTINLFDDTTHHIDVVAKKGTELPLASDLGFCQVSPIATADTGDYSEFVFRLTGTTTDLYTSEYDVSNYNLVVPYGNSMYPGIENVILPENEKPTVTIVDVNTNQTIDYDVYVNAPGTDISTVTPDATGLSLHDTYQLNDVVHVGVNFEVILCPTGTKTPAATFNTVTNAQSGTHYVFVVGAVGSSIAKQQTSVQVIPSP